MILFYSQIIYFFLTSLYQIISFFFIKLSIGQQLLMLFFI